MTRKLLLFALLSACAFGQTPAFPSRLATNTDLTDLADRAQSTLNASLNASATSFTVVAGSKFSANMILTIDSEQIKICSVVGNTVNVGHSSCPNVDGRGFGGTAAASHANGALVSNYFVSYQFKALRAELIAAETALGANLANIAALIPNPMPQNKGGTGTSSPLTGLVFGNGSSAFTSANISGIVFANGASAPTASQPSGILVGNGASPPTGTNLAGLLYGGGTSAPGAANISGIVFANGASAPTASQPSGLLVGNGASPPTGTNLTGVIIGAGTASPAAVGPGAPLAHFRVARPNAGGTIYEFQAPPVVISTDYAFPAQSPAGSIAAGNNLITLSPVPLGVNWNDAAGSNETNSHLLWVAGTGTPEACAIVSAGPGTATAGAASGTLTISCANTHAAGFTVGPISASGLPEAIYAKPANTLFSIYVPSGVHATQAKITKPNTQLASIVGAGSDVTWIQTYLGSGDTLLVDCGNVNSHQCNVSGLTFSPATARTGGYGLNAVNANYGYFYDLQSNTDYSGFLFSNFVGSHVDHVRALNYTTNGVAFTCTAGQTCGGTASNITTSGHTGCYAGMLLQADATPSYFAGFVADNIAVQGCTYNLGLVTGGGVMNEVQVVNGQLDGATGVALALLGTTGSSNTFVGSNFRISPAAGAQAIHIEKAYTDVALSTITAANTAGGSSMFLQADGAKNVAVSNVVSQGFAVGLELLSTTQPVTGFSCNQCYLGQTTTSGLYSFYTSAAAHTASITNSYLGGTISDSSTVATVYRNVPQLGAASVASNAALAFPPIAVGGIVTLTGTTTVTSVSHLFTGQTGLLLTAGAGVAFTAGATIGNSCTITTNKPYTYTFDGTKLWLSGSGC